MPSTFLFMPESAYGPTNNCVGIGNVLRERGHRVVFAAEASWRGKLAPLGFEEDLVDLDAGSDLEASGDAVHGSDLEASGDAVHGSDLEASGDASARGGSSPRTDATDRVNTSTVSGTGGEGSASDEPQAARGQSGAEPEPAGNTAGKFWTDFITATAPEFRKPTIEQLTTFVQPTWQALIDGARHCHDQLGEIIARNRPDVIVEDNVNTFPALRTAGVPFVRMMSCNPLEVRGPDVPPVFSGYSSDDRTGWDDFRAEYDRTHRPMWSAYDEWVRACGAPGLPDLDFLGPSETLNLYLYPEALDYTDRRPLDDTWHRLDSSVRTTDAAFTVPAELSSNDPSSALVYLSLGSLGSADIELMRRLVDVLSTTRHRYIVSKGPRADELDLAPNMWGDAQVPQTSVLPMVDLVISHGGNNTTTESFHFGKPMVVLPLFWDQYDNAQRVHELGYGRRLPTYAFGDAALTGAIDELLADIELRRRLDTIASTVRQRSGVVQAADQLERVAG